MRTRRERINGERRGGVVGSGERGEREERGAWRGGDEGDSRGAERGESERREGVRGRGVRKRRERGRAWTEREGASKKERSPKGSWTWHNPQREDHVAAHRVPRVNSGWGQRSAPCWKNRQRSFLEE